MASRRRLLTTEDVLEEFDLEDDYNDDEPMMLGSDDEFSDVEDDNDNNDCDYIHPLSLPVTNQAQAPETLHPLALLVMHQAQALVTLHSLTLQVILQAQALTPSHAGPPHSTHTIHLTNWSQSYHPRITI